MLRVHHVCWCLEPEDIDTAKSVWKEHFGTKLADFVQSELGIRILLNWDAGIEIIAPHGEGGSVGPQARAFLDANGAGVYTVVVDVDDLVAMTREAASAGASVLFRDEFMVGKHDARHVRQVILDEVLGMRLTLQHTAPGPQ